VPSLTYVSWRQMTSLNVMDLCQWMYDVTFCCCMWSTEVWDGRAVQSVSVWINSRSPGLGSRSELWDGTAVQSVSVWINSRSSLGSTSDDDDNDDVEDVDDDEPIACSEHYDFDKEIQRFFLSVYFCRQYLMLLMGEFGFCHTKAVSWHLSFGNFWHRAWF